MPFCIRTTVTKNSFAASALVQIFSNNYLFVYVFRGILKNKKWGLFLFFFLYFFFWKLFKMEVVLSWNKWQNFVLMLCFFLSGHFPTGCYQPCTFTVSCFILVVFKQMIRAGGRPEGWGRILNAAKPCQFFKMSPALLNTGQDSSFFDTRTSLILYSSHQQCKNVIMTSTTTTTACTGEDDHKAQHSYFLLLLWTLRADGAVRVCRPVLVSLARALLTPGTCQSKFSSACAGVYILD